MNTPTQHTVVSKEKWLEARREFLREEKEFSKLRDRLAARRRELPWVKIEKSYTFESTHGPVSFSELFEGRRQLLVYHFMFGPGWEEGCRGCSFVSDHFDGAIPHLNAKDISFVAVSSAPLAEFLPFKQRMGWNFPWVSSNGTSFNHDFGVSFTEEEIKSGKGFYNFGTTEPGGEEMPGLTAFARDEDGTLFRTYSVYARGLDPLIGAYQLIDLAPFGRNEDPEAPMSWVRHHDRYEPVAVTN